jgi:hypothetical protein
MPSPPELAFHWQNGAINPFWESVEASYLDLARCRDTLSSILDKSNQYANGVNSYRSAWGNPPLGFPEWPVRVDHVTTTSAMSGLEQSLQLAVYEAQKKGEFAIVWEQRRNTAVLATGFKTLGTAIKIGRAHV